MASEPQVIQKHLYDKNSHLELLINGNEIIVLDRFTNKEQCKLKINEDTVQFFDGIMNYNFGKEKPPKYLCEPSLNSPSGKYGIWMWGDCHSDGISNAIIDLNKDQKVMDLLCSKETGSPSGHYFWISNNGEDGLFEFWTDIYGKVQHNFYIPGKNKVLRVEEIKINTPFLPKKIFNHGNILVIDHYDWCGDGTIDYLFFDCTSFEKIYKLEGNDKEDYQAFKKLKFRENNIISITSFGDDCVGISGRGIYQYKIRKDVYQRNDNQLIKIGCKKYEIEPQDVRQKRFEIQCELIKSGVIERPY